MTDKNDAKLSNEMLAVIEFAADDSEAQAFLGCWLQGDVKAIRKEWPEFKGTLACLGEVV